MDTAGTETSISAMTPFIGLLSPVSMALEPVIIVWTREASLATLLAASFPKEPSGP